MSTGELHAETFEHGDQLSDGLQGVENDWHSGTLQYLFGSAFTSLA